MLILLQVSDNSIFVNGQIMPTARWPNINYNNLIKSNFSEVHTGCFKRKMRERRGGILTCLQAYSLLSDATRTSTYTATLTDPDLAAAVKFNMANKVKVTATFAYALLAPPLPFASLSSLLSPLPLSSSVLLTFDYRKMYYTGTCIVTSGGSGSTTFNIDCSGRDGFNGLDLTRVLPLSPVSPLLSLPYALQPPSSPPSPNFRAVGPDTPKQQLLLLVR